MTRNADLIRRREAIVARGVGRLNDVAIVSAEGATLTDADGRRYLDLSSGIGVMSAGHAQPAVVRAIAEQAAALQHISIHTATYEPYLALCEALAERLPHGGATRVMLVNSGAEAVENAVKIARQATGRAGVLCYSEAFHGRTLLAGSLTSKVGYKTGWGPYASEIYRLPFPSHYHYGDGLAPDAFVARELRRFEQALVNMVGPEWLAAVIIEPVLGEGGFVPCPPDYLRGLRALTERHGIVLILDEVQTGCCRTGRWAAYEHAGITPDLSTWAKGLGGGMPISAVIGRAEVMDRSIPGTLGGTYGGNPVACASSLATLRLMAELDLCGRATALGAQIMARLRALRERCPLVGDVRGAGAMCAVELAHDGDPHRPAREETARAIARAIEGGVLVIPSGPHGNVIRFLPPLVMTDAELDQALAVVEAAIEAAAA